MFNVLDELSEIKLRTQPSEQVRSLMAWCMEDLLPRMHMTADLRTVKDSLHLNQLIGELYGTSHFIDSVCRRFVFNGLYERLSCSDMMRITGIFARELAWAQSCQAIGRWAASLMFAPGSETCMKFGPLFVGPFKETPPNSN